MDENQSTLTVAQLVGIVGSVLGLASTHKVLVDGKIQKLSTAEWITFAVALIDLLQKSGVTWADVTAIIRAAADLAPLFGFRLPGAQE